MSRIEAGKFELNEYLFDPSETVQSSLRLVRERAANANIDLSAQVLPRAFELYGDERSLKQILLNLLTNALKFTPAGGSITLSMRGNEGDGLDVAVSDTGIGIAEADIPKVLAPFEQVESGYSRT